MFCRSLLEIRRRESGEGKVAWIAEKGSRTSLRLASRAGQFDPRSAIVSSWTRRRSVFSLERLSEKGQVCNAETLRIAASVGVALLVRVAIFLSLAPDIVWRGALEDWSLAPGDASKVRRSERRNV